MHQNAQHREKVQTPCRHISDAEDNHYRLHKSENRVSCAEEQHRVCSSGSCYRRNHTDIDKGEEDIQNDERENDWKRTASVVRYLPENLYRNVYDNIF